jgi:hypothetical protein
MFELTDQAFARVQPRARHRGRSPHRGRIVDGRRQPQGGQRAGRAHLRQLTLDRYGHLFPGRDAELRQRPDAMHAQGRQAAINRRAIEPPRRD